MTQPPDQRLDASGDSSASQLPRPSAGPDAVALLHRPVFLDLMRIQLPVGALTSIAHRISGVVLVASVPIAIYLLGLSLGDEAGFLQVKALFTRFAVKAAALVMIWALAQHVLGGVRHLLTDFDIGSPLRVVRRSAWVVNLAAVAVALFAAGALW
jgi:succinate dehydrogenase / fumarate reductase, cytochrome b subunit